MTLVENDPVRTLFGNEELPAEYPIVLQKILNDNFVLVRIQELVQRHFGALAIARAQENEYAALKKRITLALNPPSPIPSLAERHASELVARSKTPKPAGFISAKWTVMFTVTGFGEKNYFLAAKCEKCGAEAKAYGVPTYFDHCGTVEAVPEQAAKQLRRIQGRMISGDEL